MEGIWLARPDEAGAGEPVAVKDLLDTAGLTTTYGSALFADHVPAVSADAVRLLEAAGYAVAGKTNLHEFAYGISSQNAHYGTVPNPSLRDGSRAARAGARRGDRCGRRRARARDRLARLDPDPCGVVRQRRVQADATGSSPSRAASRSRRATTSWARWRPRSRGANGCCGRSRPDFEPVEARVAGGARGRGRAGSTEAEPLVRRAWRGRVERFPRRREIELPLAPANRADFMREVADVHRALFPERASCTARTSAARSSAACEVTDAEADRGRARARRLLRARRRRLVGELDLLVTPTVPFVAPPADVDELELRARATWLTYPFSSLGWPALALPAARQRTVCPPRSSSPLRRGKTRASSPPAACSNRCWRGSTGPRFPSNRLLLGRCAVTKPWRRRCKEVEEDCVRWSHPKCHMQRDGRPVCVPVGEGAEPYGREPSPARNSACRAPFGPRCVQRSDSSRRWERLSATAVRSRRGAVVGCEERRRARRYFRVAGVAERSGLRAGTAQ